ncbi:MAG TPA: DUF362 domain-containing protein [Dehalococcoidales bacterium]|nr:DUF362 domain-containing protein [Dehalococcoidales bacterium]
MMQETLKKSRVALVRCGSYEEPEVLAAIKVGLDLLDGLGEFVKPGEKILLKPNVLVGASPERCICTHPSVLSAAGKIFLEAGANVTWGDSPAVGGAMNMNLSGLKKAADDIGIELADFSHGRDVMHSGALLSHRLVIAEAVLDADGLVSLPKLKTHSLTRLTGAVKNQFGCVPGLLKNQQHARMPDVLNFAAMLVDINTLVKPRLYIMDAVIAMEGNGPRNGRPRKLGVLLLSSDPIALDAVACKLINLDPSFVPTCGAGEKAGLGTCHFERIDIVGENIEDYICADFDVVRKPVVSRKGGRIALFIKNRTSPRPVIDKSKCNHDGICVAHCPVSPKAVNWVNDDRNSPPEHNYDRCIRCFCCQELCPQGAISVETPWLGKILFR